MCYQDGHPAASICDDACRTVPKSSQNCKFDFNSYAMVLVQTAQLRMATVLAYSGMNRSAYQSVKLQEVSDGLLADGRKRRRVDELDLAPTGRFQERSRRGLGKGVE